MNLEEMLERERKRYIEIEAFIRQIAGQHLIKRGLPAVPDEKEVKMHIDACRHYYELYGTTMGKESPWIESYNKEGHL